MHPSRRISTAGALAITERQAMLLLAICGIDRVPVPIELIETLSAVTVDCYRGLPVAGASLWADWRWVIAIDTRQCRPHQRTTIAHEFKHIVDDGRSADDDNAEALADYFARCLLMPRPWLKAIVGSQSVAVDELAVIFEVPESTVRMRLHELDLEPLVGRHRASWRRRPRCRRRVCPR